MNPGNEHGPLHKLRLWVRRFGLDVRRYPDMNDSLYRLSRLFSRNNISMVLDVGAYVGEFGSSLREFGYSGTIISFEPQVDAYRMLEQRAARDPKWLALRTAVGATNGYADLNVSRNRHSSSLAAVKDRHLTADPTAEFVSREKVPITTLDVVTAREELLRSGEIFLKIDVQGYEEDVLAGASETLSWARGVQIECSLQAVYEQGMMLGRAIDYFHRLGFDLVAIEPGFTDGSSGETLQVDCVFFRGRDLVSTQ